ncbi:hypothetical protein GCM10023335_70690 [Streptomyces siamensis]|uniref:Uncharacterized protein n=1 Tax=Streptomyces siamensis TaxID=1274986 RepID=A0ABP9JHV9_9ACTN
MLPPRLLWTDPRPIPRFNKQETVTQILRSPGFYEPTDGDDCTTFWYFCQSLDFLPRLKREIPTVARWGDVPEPAAALSFVRHGPGRGGGGQSFGARR